MPDPQKDSTYAPPVKHAEKASKQKSLAAEQITSIAQVDFSKQLNREELAVINYIREQEKSNAPRPGITETQPAAAREPGNQGAEVRTLGEIQAPQAPRQTPQVVPALTNKAEEQMPVEQNAEVQTKEEVQIPQLPVQTPQVPVLNPENVLLQGAAELEAKTQSKAAKPEEKAEQYISSIVGAYAQSKEESVNMGADIAFVQKHLLRLGIMDSLTYKAEMITGGGQHKAEQIPQTIKAIYYFQKSVMGWGGNGYAKPDGGTIKYLATFTREEVIKREAKIKAKNATKAAANEKETEVKKDKQKELAQQVHDAIYGIGTDEEAVYQALMQLNKNDAKIKEFRELYASTFKADLVNDIEWDFSGKEEARALGLLNISDGKGKIIENDTSSGVYEDIGNIREILNFSLGDSVGEGGKNNTHDVRMIAKKFKELKYAGLEEAISKGKCNDALITNIKQFQKDVIKIADPSGVIDPGGSTIKKLFIKSGSYSSGLNQIYGGRSAINNKFRKGFISDLKGDVGENLKDNTAENNNNDVKLVASRLISSGINSVPQSAINTGICSSEFINSIKEYQRKVFSKAEPDGNITKGGKTDKKLSNYKRYTIGTLAREGDTGYGAGISKNEYYSKIDSLKSGLGIEDKSDLNRVLVNAKKTAIDEKYYNKVIAGISSKLIIAPKEIEEGETKLSSILQYRMERFHKYLVAVGLYNGDMDVSDGVRSKKKAHGFAVQYHIAVGNHASIIQNNLIELFKKSACKKAEDENGFIWAKKEHFTVSEDKKTIKIKYAEVQKYVKGLKLGRSNITDPASAGYSEMPKCLPLPEGKGVSNHTKGLAMDINRHKFLNAKDAIIDLIGLTFGVVRAGGWKETWHFELSDLGISGEEKKLIKSKKR